MIDSDRAWILAREDFSPDGALRDIYVHDADLSDWNQIIALVRKHSDDAIFAIATDVTELPLELTAHHFSGGDQHGSVQFTAGNVAIVAYLFTPDEIELSFDPSDVNGPAALANVLDLVQNIGEELGKRVDVTPENACDSPIFSFDPRDRSIRYVPAEPTRPSTSPVLVTITSLEGPVEALDGRLVLRIPLSQGGAALADCARGISEVVDDELYVFISGWLAEKLGICEGSIVIVDNRNGRFNIMPDQPS